MKVNGPVFGGIFRFLELPIFQKYEAHDFVKAPTLIILLKLVI